MTKKKKKKNKVSIGFLTKDEAARREAVAKRDRQRMLKSRKIKHYFNDPLRALQLLRTLTKLAGHFGVSAAAGFNLNNERLATLQFYDQDDDLPVDREAEARRRLRRDLYRRIANGEFAGVEDVIQLQSCLTILEDQKQRDLYLPEGERPYVFTFKHRDVL